MKREELDHALAIMQAVASPFPTEIQYRQKDTHAWHSMVQGTIPDFNWDEFEYRIKPTEVKYRLFFYKANLTNAGPIEVRLGVWDSITSIISQEETAKQTKFLDWCGLTQSVECHFAK